MITLNKSDYPLFFSGLFIKLICSLFFASYFLTDLFVPFVEYFINSGFSDPYLHFLETGQKEAFPYPALMLIILALPKLIFGWISDNQSFVLLLYRIPLLLCDITIFFILRSWISDISHRYLIWLYWLSPVLIYISFIHGQLDVIPISLLVVALHFLFKANLTKSAIFFGLSLATKTMVIIVLPFLILYFIKQKFNLKEIILFILFSLVAFLVPNLPFLTSEAFYLIVFDNQEQEKIYNALITLGSSSIFLIPVAYLLLLFKGFTIRTFNRDIFMMFLGFAFGIILIFVPPMPGWYFWLLPFLFYFYSKAKSRSFYLVVLLQLCYLIYFSVVSESDYLESFYFFNEKTYHPNLYETFHSMGLDPDKISNLFLSLLQTVLILNCYWIYQYGLNSYSKYKISSLPFLLGIGGNSGAGKTTIAKALEAVFQEKKTTMVNGDDIHRWERGNNKWSKFTHLDPKANHLHNEIEMLKDLKRGSSIYRRKYDHIKGTFGTEKQLKPNNLILYEGLHPFYLKRLRELFDLKIFISPTEELMSSWKLKRDVTSRDKTKEEVLKQMDLREKDSVRYINIQSEHADVIIEPSIEDDTKGDQSNLIFKLTLPNSISFDPIIEEIEKIKTLDIQHSFNKTDTQELSIEGHVSKEEVSSIASKCIDGLKDIGITDASWPKDPFGVVVMIVTYLVFEEAYYEKTREY